MAKCGKLSRLEKVSEKKTEKKDKNKKKKKQQINNPNIGTLTFSLSLSRSLFWISQYIQKTKQKQIAGNDRTKTHKEKRKSERELRRISFRHSRRRLINISTIFYFEQLRLHNLNEGEHKA